MPAHSAMGSTVKPLSRFLMSYTTTDWDIFGSGFSGASEYKCCDFGWLLMNSEPPPWLDVSTTFQAYCLWPFGSVPISEMVSSPKWPVDQTGPYLGEQSWRHGLGEDLAHVDHG